LRAPGLLACRYTSSPIVCHSTGIWAAALDGDLDSVQRFIAKGTDPNQTDRFGYTALHYSSRHGNLSVCRLLLDSGADSNAQTHGGSTPLHRAAYCGHILVVKLLLDRGADPAMVDSDGRTALHKVGKLRCYCIVSPQNQINVRCNNLRGKKRPKSRLPAQSFLWQWFTWFG
uniref:Ankyrin repeat domain 39 n=1 Tax=Leptobrachium leishanense TaxID=445787 RepID=A0A8C5M4I8_9ANUR